MSRISIKNYSLEEATGLLRELGEQEYRARQLFNWLYEKTITSFSEMTNFSKDLRSRLDEKFTATPLKLDEHLLSADGTEKFLFETGDGYHIESVLIRNEGNDDGRLTVCLSSQIGCTMGCRFCSTARLPFRRNLEPGEILDQLCQVRRITGLRNNNIVFMGMGEPLMNYDNVLKAADIMNYSFGFHISVRKITISTCGVLPAIERFIDEKRPYNLALSLNDTDFEKRKEYMPVEGKYPFRGIIDLLNRKFPFSRNRVTIEYVMRKDNISRDDAYRLKKMFRYNKIKLNLIPLNRGGHTIDEPDKEDIDRFVEYLQIMNVPISVRKSFGDDISGACGQLSGKKYRSLTNAC